MEKKLEQLLNSLIKRGRVPFGDEKIHSFEIIYVTGKIWNIVAKRGRGQVNKHYSIIELCSKSSGLWQFVCENGMIENPREDFRWTNDFQLDYIEFNQTDFQYWVLESSLKDESELEDFLLNSIKLEGRDE